MASQTFRNRAGCLRKQPLETSISRCTSRPRVWMKVASWQCKRDRILVMTTLDYLEGAS
jgi:hypothetical protein